METHIFELGSVTYEIQRTFGGERPAAELIREQLEKQLHQVSVNEKKRSLYNENDGLPRLLI